MLQLTTKFIKTKFINRKRDWVREEILSKADN
jgi:hypothetical protein